MVKYRLKKDLPFAKAGAMLKNNNCVIDEDGKNRYLSNWNEEIEACTKRLLNDGWIEEVKPREWIIEVTKEQQYIRPADAKGRLYSSGSEIIKVREVIE